MQLFIFSMAAFALAGLGLAIGYIVKGKSLKGSCGGLNNLATKDGKSYCEICGADGVEQNFCD